MVEGLPLCFIWDTLCLIAWWPVFACHDKMSRLLLKLVVTIFIFMTTLTRIW